MNRPTARVRALALVLLLAPLAGAQSIKLSDGTVVRGRATAYDDAKQVLSFRTESGKEVDYRLDQLDERSVYMVHASLVPEDSGRGQLQLANFARDIGLYKHSARRYGLAEKADPSLKDEVEQERTVLREKAADFCLEQAQEAQAKGDTKEAEKWLTLLIEKLPGEPQAEQAATMLDGLYTTRRHAQDDELEREHAELIQKDLKEAKRRYDRMIELTKAGLTSRGSTAVKDFEGAISDGAFVLKEIEGVRKKYPDVVHVQEGAVKYRALATGQMVDAHLHLASHYTVQTDYKNALRQANAALALDPSNQAATAQRARIEQEANDGIGVFSSRSLR